MSMGVDFRISSIGIVLWRGSSGGYLLAGRQGALDGGLTKNKLKEVLLKNGAVAQAVRALDS